jgi:hypothetical protein
MLTNKPESFVRGVIILREIKNFYTLQQKQFRNKINILYRGIL